MSQVLVSSLGLCMHASMLACLMEGIASFTCLARQTAVLNLLLHAASSGMVLGQDPALTELPHMNMNPHGYQAMITDDDDWLQDFASAQLQVHDHDSPSSVHNEPEAEQARQHAVPDNNIDATTRKQAAEEKIEV